VSGGEGMTVRKKNVELIDTRARISHLLKEKRSKKVRQIGKEIVGGICQTK